MSKLKEFSGLKKVDSSMAEVKSVADFNSAIDNNNIVVADFWAPWCGPCKMLMPTIETLSDKNVGKASFVKLNIDEDAGADAAAIHGVRAVPTIIVFAGSKEVKRFSGITSAKAIQDVIDGLA